MYHFKDYYNNTVSLSFANHPFTKDPKHVLVICKYKGKWLLTSHKERGLEFPGGKVENGETPEEGAIREVLEETGGIVNLIHYVGQYYVAGKREKIAKNIYYAEVAALEKQRTYFETDGPVLLDCLSDDIKNDKSYSFIMKDDVITYVLNYLQKQKDEAGK